MNKLAVNPDQHPVEQYRTEWVEIVQFLAILYLHSKSSFYKSGHILIEPSNVDTFNQTMSRYRSLEELSTEFFDFLQGILSVSEYGEVRGLFEQVQRQLVGGNFHEASVKKIFTSIRDDVQHVNAPKIRPVLTPLITYFKNNSVPNRELETQIIGNLDSLRNPRIRRVLDIISSDLDKMVALAPTSAPKEKLDPTPKEEPDLSTTLFSSNQIQSMSKGDRIYLTQHTTNGKTLQNLAFVAKVENDKSILSALFFRGFMNTDFILQLYLTEGLVTISNFVKLKDEVLFEYLKYAYTFGEKTSWGKDLLRKGVISWKELLKGRPEVAYNLMLYGVSGDEFFKTVTSIVSPDRWGPDQIRTLWQYAENQEDMVHRLSKQDRLKSYLDIFYSITPSFEAVWLFDCTRSDLEPFLKVGKLKNEAFVDKVFGYPWHVVPLLQIERYMTRITPENVTKFLQNLNRDDILLLDSTYQFTASFSRYFSKWYGVTTLTKEWNTFSDVVKTWLFTFLPTNFKDVLLEEIDKSDPLRGVLLNAEEIQNRALKAKVELLKKKYYNINDMTIQDLTEYFSSLDPGLLVEEFFKISHNKGSFLETIVATRCSRSTVATLLTRYDSLYDTTITLCISRLRPGDYIQLLTLEGLDSSLNSEPIKNWIANNMPSMEIVSQIKSKKNFWLLFFICNRVKEFSKADIQLFLSALTEMSKFDYMICLIEATPELSSSYVNHPNPKIRKAALKGASFEDALKIMDSTEYPMISGALERADFPEKAVDFLQIHVDKLMNDSLRWSNSWASELRTSFDKKVLKMTTPQFEAVIDFFNKNQETRNALYTVKPFGINSIIRAIQTKNEKAFSLFNEQTKRDGYFDEYEPKYVIETWPLMKLIEYKPDFLYWANVIRECLRIHIKYDGWLTSLTNDQILAIKEKTKAYINPDSLFSLDFELKNREAIQKEQDKIGIQNQIQQALDRQDAKACANALSGVKDLRVCEKFFTSKSIATAFKMEVIQNSNDQIFDFLWGLVSTKSLFVESCPKIVFDKRFPGIIKEMTEKYEPDYIERDTKAKASMVLRADAEQAMTLFKYFYEVQGSFGPKVRDAFLEKIDEDDDFKKNLINFLKSKEFNLRKKQFTIEMVPIAVKLDSTEVTEKFNKSSRAQGDKIVGALEYWDKIQTPDAKKKWLDEVNDRGMLYKLLKALVERAMPLSAPLESRFTLGTNDLAKTGSLLNAINTTTQTITHKELFDLSMYQASNQDIKSWLLSNPMRVFDFVKADITNINAPSRIESIPQAEEDSVIEWVKNSWKGSRRNIRPEFKGVFKVTNLAQKEFEKRKNPSSNIKTLMHGTHYFATGLIIQNHFKVMSSNKAKSGRMLGDGIYFADVAAKCAQYISASFGRGEDTGCLLLCEVDLGNMLSLNRDNSHMATTWKSYGYDSVFYPKEDSTGYGGRDSEYAVADVSRIRVKYVVHLERVRDTSGEW